MVTFVSPEGGWMMFALARGIPSLPSAISSSLLQKTHLLAISLASSGCDEPITISQFHPFL
jgi:hypothetical protein